MGAAKEPALASAAMVEGGASVEGTTTVGPAIGACRNLLWLVCASSPAPALLRSEGAVPSAPPAPAAPTAASPPAAPAAARDVMLPLQRSLTAAALATPASAPSARALAPPSAARGQAPTLGRPSHSLACPEWVTVGVLQGTHTRRAHARHAPCMQPTAPCTRHAPCDAACDAAWFTCPAVAEWRRTSE